MGKKREKEDIFDYLIRVACVVGLIQLDRVPKSISETRTLDNVWTRILFLIGLDEDEQDNLLTESSGTKMEDMCRVLCPNKSDSETTPITKPEEKIKEELEYFDGYDSPPKKKCKGENGNQHCLKNSENPLTDSSDTNDGDTY